MSEFKKTTLQLEHTFDAKKKRHYLNGQLTVLHCHHFTTLYTQLALDAGETALLHSCSESAFYPALTDYFTKHSIVSLDERLEIGCQYYAALGLGTIKVAFAGNDSGRVVSENSHIDSGWIKKWGKFDKPVNYVGTGYIAALFAAAFSKPEGNFAVSEVSSIVMGEKESLFNVVRK
jgi:hypothetical protein